MSNNHYISRFQTREYETSINGQKRQLYYYDFFDKKIKIKASKSLFAEDLKAREDSKVIEDFESIFNYKLETPISNFLDSLTNITEPLKPTEQQLKAIILFHLLSTCRILPISKKEIIKMLEVPALPFYLQEKYGFYYITLNEDLPFFNSLGSFCLVMKNEIGEIKINPCYQYSKRFIVITIDKKYKPTKEVKLIFHNKYSLERSSIGFKPKKNVDKIVIDSKYIKNCSEKDIIRKIELYREFNTELQDTSNSINRLTLELDACRGLKPDERKKHHDPFGWNNWWIR